MLDALEIMHKYAMDRLEASIVKRMMEDSRITSAQEKVEMVLASRIVNSTELYEKAINQLANERERISLEQAKLLGLEAYFEAMSLRYEQEARYRR
jgi:hypothetical protein